MGEVLKKVVLVFVVMALLSPWTLVRAAENRDRETRIAEKLEALRNWKLMDVLDLSQEEAQELFMVLRRFDSKRRALLEERRTVRRRLIRAARGQKVNGDVRALAARYLAIGTELAKLREQELRALEKRLTPQEEAKYLLFMDRFHREIIRMLSRVESRLRTGKEGKVPKVSPSN